MAVDLTQDIRITKETPTKDLEGALNGIRSKLLDLEKNTDGVTREALERAAKDIESIKGQAEDAIKEAMAAREMAKIGARTMPASKLDDAELRAFPRSKRSKPDPEHSALFTGDSRRALYDFLTADPNEVRSVLSDDAFALYQKARRVHDALVIIDAGISAALSSTP